MVRTLHPAVLLALCCPFASAAPNSPWTRANSEAFEIYSDAGADSARSTLEYFQRLRAFFLSYTNLNTGSSTPVRIIVFRSAEEFNPYRVRPNAAAFYIGTESRNYIVMPALSAEHLSVAAHEYVHFLIHANSLPLPAWLNEGLSDVFSTLMINERSSSVGGDLSGRSRLLRNRHWLSLQELVVLQADSPLRNDPNLEGLFYAESWALTHMLLLSPGYSPHFPELVTAIAAGLPTPSAFARVYAKSMEAMERDLHSYVADRRFMPVSLPGVSVPPPAIRISSLTPIDARSMLADLVSATGDRARATALYRELARESPESADFPAALGSIALRNGDRNTARREWQRAVQLGIADPVLCYRYAVLAQEADQPDEQVRPALERAVALQPDFDDARYLLGLLEKRTGHYEAGLVHLRAMQNIAPKRAYAYWTAVADMLLELDRREEARAAAQQAREHASTSSERALASQLAYMAETDLAVQFTRDTDGRPKLSTTRTPHNTPVWNPFIEPGDRMQRGEGTLKEIQCDGPVIHLAVTTAAGTLALILPDPSRVQLRNLPSGSFEFTCGPQPDRTVAVEYNQTGLLRGIEFH